jgi:hypothetical protein
MTSPFLLD